VDRLLHLAPERTLTVYAQWQIRHALACVADVRGDLPTAQLRFQQALDTARQLLTREPHNRNYALAAAMSQLDLARPIWLTSAEATRAMEGAVESMRRIYAQDPHDGRVFRLLCGALLRRGHLALDAEDHAMAARLSDEVLELVAQADARQSREATVASFKAMAIDLLARTRSSAATRPASAPSS
jgi:hypothetical protein